jgi:hypothetical protein
MAFPAYSPLHHQVTQTRKMSEECCIIVLSMAVGDTDVEKEEPRWPSVKQLGGIWESGHATLDARTMPRHHPPGLDKA